MNNMTHSSFYSYNFLNIGIHRRYVSCYSHSYFFLDTNYQIWVYKGMKIHFLLDT